MNLFESKEYIIFDYLIRTGNAYTALLNSGLENYEAAKTALKEMRLAAKHLELVVRAALVDWNVPPHLIRNLQAWTKDNLESKYLNTQHHYYRFLHAQSEEQKIKELTAMHSICLDLVEILDVVQPENYYKVLIQ